MYLDVQLLSGLSSNARFQVQIQDTVYTKQRSIDTMTPNKLAIYFVADMVVADIDFPCGRYGFLLWPISSCCGRYGLWPICSHPLIWATLPESIQLIGWLADSCSWLTFQSLHLQKTKRDRQPRLLATVQAHLQQLWDDVTTFKLLQACSHLNGPIIRDADMTSSWPSQTVCRLGKPSV